MKRKQLLFFIPIFLVILSALLYCYSLRKETLALYESIIEIQNIIVERQNKKIAQLNLNIFEKNEFIKQLRGKLKLLDYTCKYQGCVNDSCCQNAQKGREEDEI